GNATGVIDPRGQLTLQGYDQLGRLVSTTDPLGRTAARGYDVLGRGSYETDFGGHTPPHHDHAAGPSHVKNHPPGAPTTTLSDRAGNVTGVLTFAGPGATTGTLGGLRSTRYLYDAADRRVTKIDPMGSRTTYQLDPAGNATGVVDPLWHVTQQSFDPLNRLT